MTANEVALHVGIPYKDGAFGPDAYNCWSLLIHIQQTYFGNVVSSVPLGNESACRAVFQEKVKAGEWRQVEKPQHGDCVLLRGGVAPHVGVYLDVEHGGVLHAVETFGVMFTPMNQLSRIGYGRSKFYRVINAA